MLEMEMQNENELKLNLYKYSEQYIPGVIDSHDSSKPACAVLLSDLNHK